MNFIGPGSPSSSEGLDAARKYFESVQLEMPFIHQEEKRKIIHITDAGEVFGSKTPLKNLYDINTFVGEVLSKPISDYVVMGLAGHGVKSRAIHYYAVKEHLALFVQINEQESRDAIDGTFHAIQYIFEALEAKNKALPEGKRLLIIQSDFYASGYGWIQGQPGKIDETTWKTEDPLLNALSELDEL